MKFVDVIVSSKKVFCNFFSYLHITKDERIRRKEWTIVYENTLKIEKKRKTIKSLSYYKSISLYNTSKRKIGVSGNFTCSMLVVILFLRSCNILS